MQQQDRLIRTALAIVKATRLANQLFLAAVATGLVASWVVPGFFGRLVLAADSTADVPAALAGLRMLMVIGVIMAVASDRLLASLIAIVASAQHGDPFVPNNARRLQEIGWALLTLQLLDIPCALLARFWPSLGSAAPSGAISVGGWVATLMVFVLARVFAAGTVMRDDLAGIV